MVIFHFGRLFYLSGPVCVSVCVSVTHFSDTPPELLLDFSCLLRYRATIFFHIFFLLYGMGCYKCVIIDLLHQININIYKNTVWINPIRLTLFGVLESLGPKGRGEWNYFLSVSLKLASNFSAKTRDSRTTNVPKRPIKNLSVYFSMKSLWLGGPKWAKVMYCRA